MGTCGVNTKNFFMVFGFDVERCHGFWIFGFDVMKKYNPWLASILKWMAFIVIYLFRNWIQLVCGSLKPHCQ